MIVRVTNEYGLRIVRDKLLPPPGVDREAMIAGIVLLMNELPSHLLFFISVHQKEKMSEPSIDAFLIAIAQPNLPYVSLVQAWFDEKSKDKKENQIRFFDFLDIWMDSLGRDEIKFEGLAGEECKVLDLEWIPITTIYSWKREKGAQDELVERDVGGSVRAEEGEYDDGRAGAIPDSGPAGDFGEDAQRSNTI